MREKAFGPKGCSPACESRVFLEEYEKVDREYERQLVRSNASLRIQVNNLEAIVTELRDPEETRPGDGKRVRKDRWESGIRELVVALGWSAKAEFEVADVVTAVRKVLDDAKPRTNAARGEKK